MSKNEFIEYVECWIFKEIEDTSWEVIKTHSRENLSKTSNKTYKDIDNLANMDFKTDLTFVVKKDRKLEVGFVNCTNKSIGIRDIGELQIYSRATNPLFAFIVSSKGFSSEISPFLMDNLKCYMIKFFSF